MFKKIDKECISEKMECGKRTAKKIISDSKDITLHGKTDTALEIKSTKSGKSIFAFDFKCDKEISLYKIIAYTLAIIAGIALISATLEAMMGKSCNKSDDCDD